MAIKWGVRRQILYYIVAWIIFSILSFFVWQTFLTTEPTCFDRVQNGTESGVDCGGSCALLCRDTAKAPTMLWARAFESAPHTYTAVAYLRNNNVAISAGARNVRYIFSLYDEKNVLVAEREGVLDIPPVLTVPVVELGIDSGTRNVARAFFKLTDQEIAWVVVPKESIQKLRVSNVRPYQDNRVVATIVNDSFDDAKRVHATAVLFDSEGIARGATRATVAEVSGKSSETVTFTWPEALFNIINQEVIVLPSF